MKRLKFALLAAAAMAFASAASAAIVDADLATIRDAGWAGDASIYRGTGVVTAIGFTSGRNQFTMQDGTGALFIDDSAGVFNTDAGVQAAVGDNVTVTGTLSTFNDLIQFVPDGVTTGRTNAVNSSGNALPKVLVLANLAAIATTEQAELVGVKNVFLNDNNDATWTLSTNYGLEDGFANTSTFRVGSGTTGWDGNGKPAQSTVIDVVGTINWFNAGQVHARSDFTGDGTVAWNDDESAGPDVVSPGTVPVELSILEVE